MLIPEYKAAQATESQACFTQLGEIDQYKKLRTATTDKVIAVLFTAEWDEASKVLKEMV